jgi:uncharacterized protein
MDGIEEIMKVVKERLSTCSAHDFGHVMRVYNMALKLSESEDVDMEVVKAAALLHDVSGDNESKDPTGGTDHAMESARIARTVLEGLGYSEEKISHIENCIISHRYRTDNKPKTREAEIVFDADKLETVGAIGIARAFSWIGKNNAHIYRKVDIEEYAKENLCGKINGRIQDKTKHSVQINWETKDKHILEYLYTDRAREIAKERKAFYQAFLERLEREIKGEL